MINRLLCQKKLKEVSFKENSPGKTWVDRVKMDVDCVISVD